MKNKILLLGLFILGCSSCDNFLSEDPLSYVSEVNYYKTENDAIGAINAAYAAMRDEAVGVYTIFLNDLSTDDLRVGLQNNTVVYHEVERVSYKSSHEYFKKMWTLCYNCINRANVVLKYVQQGDQISKTVADRVHAEARFLRAFQYFRLVQWFGDIPLVLTPPEGGDMSSLYPARTPIADVYRQIVEDFKFAEEHLDNKYEYTDSKNGGRATRGAAKVYLAKVYLTMAGYPLKDPTTMVLAAEKLKEVMDHKADFGYDLMPDYADIFDKTKKAANKEAVWYLSGTTGLTNNGWYYTRMHQWYIGYASVVPTVSESAKVCSPAGHVNYSPDGLYEAGDKRRLANIRRRGNKVLLDMENASGGNNNGVVVCGKYADFENGSYAENDYPYTRYSDVVLMRAEALCELAGENSSKLGEAAALLDPLFERAGTVCPPYTTQAELRDIIRTERRRELLFEGHRWTDLVRWEIFVPTLKAHLKREYNMTEAELAYISPNMMRYPIPADEITANPNLKPNNEGYN